LYSNLIEFGVPVKLIRLIKMCLNESYSKVHTDRNLVHAFSTQNGLKQGDTLSLLLFKFAVEYVIVKVQQTHGKLKSNGTHKHLVYEDSVLIH